MNTGKTVSVRGDGWAVTGRILQDLGSTVLLEYAPDGIEVITGWFHGPAGIKPGRRMGDSASAPHTFEIVGAT